MRYFRSRLQIGVNYNLFIPAAYPTSTPTNFITLQGGLKGNTAGSTAFGELCIEDKSNMYGSNISKIGGRLFFIEHTLVTVLPVRKKPCSVFITRILQHVSIFGTERTRWYLSE